MGLRAVKPSVIEKRLKAFFYGMAGVGKTTASISFPCPYLIDCEKGATNEQYVEILESKGGVIFQTTDFDELIEEIKSLLVEKHAYRTLVIDPLTTLYNDLLDKAEARVGNEFGRHYGEANKKMKHLIKLLMRLDMNVIITAHAKNEYGGDMKVLGQTYDCYKKLDYLFDLVFEVQKRGKERIGIVKKSRVKNFGDGEQFPFNYDTIADKYGRHILEREAIQEILATPEQVSKIKSLIELLKIPEDITQKWLDKVNAETFDEMTVQQIESCINYLQSKILGA